jgi:MFS family permease
VLPGQVRDVLGFSAFIAGVVIGLQSFATVLTRHFAGNKADLSGAKITVQSGLLFSAGAGLTYLVSSFFIHTAFLSLLILITGRLILGLGESLLITGALMWGIGLMGNHNSGKVMAWNGIAMYAALSVGAPIGLIISHAFLFHGVSLAVIFPPLVGLMLTKLIPNVHEKNILAEKEPFFKIVKSVWIYGLGMGLGTIGFGALSSFIVLYFKQKSFGNAGVAMLIFGACYTSVRLVAGHLPDQIGGKKVAIASLSVEALGQCLIWLAPNLLIAYLGVALTGFGFSLVFPAFGVQAIKNMPAHSRGSAVGAFFAFFDIALGITGPLCGAVGSMVGFSAIYLMGALAALGGFLIAMNSPTDSRTAS